MSEVEGKATASVDRTRYDDHGTVSLDGLVQLDEPERLMHELEAIAEDRMKRNPRADSWRFIAKWAKECNEELAKSQEPKGRGDHDAGFGGETVIAKSQEPAAR